MVIIEDILIYLYCIFLFIFSAKVFSVTILSNKPERGKVDYIIATLMELVLVVSGYALPLPTGIENMLNL